MTRRCSHCSNNGHNSRTCPSRGGGVKLFGVRLTDGSIMKKSASMGNLSGLYHSSSPAAVSPNPNSPATSDPVEGYLSDDPAHASCSAKRRAARKKGTPWTEEEHRKFLVGLQILGKGDWRGIARTYVLSRTPTQVASHAQKYFIRQGSNTRRKRRSSLFDMAPDNTVAEPPEDHFMLPPSANSDHSDNPQCSLQLSLKPDSDQLMEPELTEIKLKHEMKEEEEGSMTVSELPPIIPAFYPAYIPVPFPVWPSTMASIEEADNKLIANESHHRVVKPIPILQKEPLNLDELVGMSSQLTLKDTTADNHHKMEPSSLSLKLLAEPSRQSAFHASVGTSGVNKRDGNAFRAS